MGIETPPIRPVRVRMRPARRRWRRWLPPRRVTVAAAVVLAAVVLVGVAALREALALRSDALAGEQKLRAARSVLESGTAGRTEFRLTLAQLGEARTHLQAAEVHFDAAGRHRSNLGPALWAASWLPGWAGGAGEVEPLLETSRLLALAGEHIANGLTPLVRQVDGPPDPNTPAGMRLSAALTEAEPHLRLALQDLDRAQQARARVDDRRLGGPLAPARRGLDEFDAEWPSLRGDVVNLVDLAPAARAVLGMDRPRTFAVLGQNSAEIRPTGGFIGSLGIVTLDGGRVRQQDYRSSYSFDNPLAIVPPAPPALARHIGGGGWLLRDANWSPDFPTSAQAVEYFLLRHQGITVDGVIAFDTYAVGEILRALGPVTVPGFAAPVTADEWYDLATELIYSGDADPQGAQANKGQVLAPMLRAVLDRVQTAGPQELPDLLRALRTAVAGRHILVYFHDPAPATLARRTGADGRLAPPRGADVLYVVDANLSYSKVAPYIRERISYEAWLSPRGVATESRVAVSYQNTVTADTVRRERVQRIGGAEWDEEWKLLRTEPGVLGTYVRVFIPRSSRLLDLGEDASVPALEEEAGLLSIGRYVRVPAGSSARFEYGYQVPEDLTPRGTYRLQIIKQPGTAGHQLEVRLNLPPGARLRIVSPELARDGDTLVFRGRLTHTLEFSVTFAPAGE